MNRLTTAACLAACLSAHSAAAQAPPAFPHVELSVGITGMSRGPGEGSERALAALGFHEGYGARGMTQTGFDGFWKVEIGTSARRSLGILTTRTANRTSGVGEVPGAGNVQISTDHMEARARAHSRTRSGSIGMRVRSGQTARRFRLVR